MLVSTDQSGTGSYCVKKTGSGLNTTYIKKISGALNDAPIIIIY